MVKILDGVDIRSIGAQLGLSCFLARRHTCRSRNKTTTSTMASFPYPKDLLHNTIEDQWFPRSKKETESSCVDYRFDRCRCSFFLRHAHSIIIFSPMPFLCRILRPSCLPTWDSLTAIESAEAAYRQKMARILQPDAPPVVIGRQHHGRSGRRRRQSSRERRPSTSDSTTTSTTTTTTGGGGGGGGDGSSATVDTGTEGDDVSTIVQQRAPQRPPAPTTLFWNRVAAAATPQPQGQQQPSGQI